MSVADEIVAEVAQKLRLAEGDPPRFYFSAKPGFLLRRLLDLSAPDRKLALERVAVFAYFLANEKGSPEAGRALLDVLDEVAKRVLHGGRA
jgi:hypothetical protein